MIRVLIRRRSSRGTQGLRMFLALDPELRWLGKPRNARKP